MRAKIILFFRFLVIATPAISRALEKGDKSDTFLLIFYRHFSILSYKKDIYITDHLYKIN